MGLTTNMKSVIKFWTVAGLVLILLFVLTRLCDQYAANGDGYLGALNINILFQYLAFFWATLTLLSLGLASGRGWLTNLSLSLSSLLFFWFVAEILCFCLIQFKLVDASRPFHSRLLLNKDWKAGRRPFWGDFDRTIGRWRLPNDTLSNVICNGNLIHIKTNQFGMRDRPRTLQNLSGRKRVVLLGDSFIEGYIVEAHQRYSDILESQTQSEHLNFGISSASVISYYLTYKSMAQRFDHDVVLVSLLPANDFEDYNDGKKQELLRHPIYRPYWEGQFPNVTLRYSLSDLSQSFVSLHGANKPIHTQQVVDSVYHSMPFADRMWAELSLNSYLYSCVLATAGKVSAHRRGTRNSFVVNNDQRQWDTFAYSLEQLAKAAQGKQIIAYLVPIESDLQAFDKTHQNDLKKYLDPICRKYDIKIIDFLPIFHALGKKQWQKLYLTCDGHFTPEGEQFVASFLLKDSTYQRAVGIPSAHKIALK